MGQGANAAQNTPMNDKFTAGSKLEFVRKTMPQNVNASFIGANKFGGPKTQMVGAPQPYQRVGNMDRAEKMW